MFLHLLKMRQSMLSNQVRALENSRVRGLGLLLLAVTFWAGIYTLSHWFLLQTLSMEPIGEMVVRHLLSMMVFFLFVILIFSNLVAAFSSFFLSDDLQFLMTAPLPKNEFFAARFVENPLYRIMDDADLRCGTVYSHRYLNEGLRCLLFNHTSHLCQFLYRALSDSRHFGFGVM